MRRTIRLIGLAVMCGLTWTAVGAAENRAVNVWSRLGDGPEGERTGSVLVFARDANRLLLLGGEHQGAAPVQALDLATVHWSEFATNALKNPIHPYYQATYHPKTKTVYCLSNGSILYSFNAEEKSWQGLGPAPALEQLSWLTMACDPEGDRLVVVGADKRVENVGWTRTVVYDLATKQWDTLPLPNVKRVKEHHELVTLIEATIELVGRTRLAWYRDPKGIGTDAELKALGERCDHWANLPGMTAFQTDLGRVVEALKTQNTLKALKSARALQRKLEERAVEQYPVPPSRRNAPLVYDEKNRVFVLFGGDHEDYQMNDTWILDLPQKSWRRAKPEIAPSPRAGHAMVYLPKSGRVALYEGYAASSDPSYGASPSAPLNPRELWLYDADADRWDLAGAWPAKGGREPAPPSVGGFYGYSSSWFAVPALAADREDQLFFFTPSRKEEPSAVWTLRVDPGATDVTGRDKLGQPPNQRRVREEYFRADYCEVADGPKQLDLAAIPANQWVPFPRPARVPASGCRQRDWGTVIWDSDREQVLLWGGGHCVRSSSVVLHFSPAANRFAEGYDADEPYCYNGFCGPGSSLLNRQWIDCHGYNLYAYDPKCRLLVTARGFLYDPGRMDWVRAEPFRPPFAYSWGSVVIETSAHGAVAWAKKTNSDEFNLWLFDRDRGWTDLQPRGKLHACYCDSDGMVYDSQRDRLLLGWGGGYGKRGDGTITVFDFKTKAVEKITPENLELGRTSGTREMVYVPEADLVLFGSEGYGIGDPKTGKRLTRVYDCGKNRYVLLDGGPVAYGHSAGWMYDTQRHCAYVMTYRGECWAMRIAPLTLSLLDKAPEPVPIVTKLTPASSDEALAEKFSMAKAAESLDRVSLHWTQQHKCGSCHATFPYLMSRGVLKETPSPALTEVRAFFEGHIADWNVSAKTNEHLHPEIVGLAASLAVNDAQTTGKLQPLARQALDLMWTIQREDGAWNWPKCHWPPFEQDDYYGAVLAAVGVSLAPQGYAQGASARTGLAKLRKYLQDTPPPSLHHKTWLLWASVKLDGLMPPAVRGATVKELLALQRRDGGWSLESLGQDWVGHGGAKSNRDAPSDGYGTGLVVYVLRQSGVPASDAAMQGGVNWLRTHQRASGRWFTPSLNGVKEHYISDAATAFAVLALRACE